MKNNEKSIKTPYQVHKRWDKITQNDKTAKKTKQNEDSTFYGFGGRQLIPKCNQKYTGYM